MGDRVVASTCRECSVRCGSLIHLRNGRVGRITGNPAHPHTQGAFCVKGAKASIAAREHPDRPLHPMRRTGSRGAGQWERISWQQALGEIADRLETVIGKHGPLAVAGAVSNHFVSRGVAMAQLLRCIGSPNYMINQDLCQGCRYTAAMLTGVGAQPGNELAHARCILVVGKSPSESSVVQWMHIKAARRRGARLIVIDPRRTQIARMADLWLPLRPGTDAALALAMAHVMIGEGLHERQFVAQWCVGFEPFSDRVRGHTPAWASDITGVPAEQIVKAARCFAAEKPGCLVLGHGIDAQANGVDTARAFHALVALTGNVDRAGTNRMAKRSPGFRDYASVIHDPEFRLPREVEESIVGGRKYPLWAGPQSWAKSCHNPSVIQAMLTGEPYPVRALYVSGVNIVCTYPGVQNTIDALKGLELLAVATDHMTPTAELADIVLPKTTLLEEEDVTSDPSGPCLSVVQRVLPPRGEARCDMEIAVALRDELRKRGLVRYEVLPWNSHRGFIEFQLRDTGLVFDDLCEKGFHEFPFVYEEYRKKGFPTPSGKIELASSRLEQAGYDPVPNFSPPVYAASNPEFPLTLLTGIRSMAYHHSRFRNHHWARKAQNMPGLRIHPRTAGRHGIVEGGWVRVETPNGAGRVLLSAWITEEVPEDIVATGMGWWFPELPGPDHGALTFNVDAAIPYGPPWDPIAGSAEARNCACRIRRAEPGETALSIAKADELAGR